MVSSKCIGLCLKENNKHLLQHSVTMFNKTVSVMNSIITKKETNIQ